MWLVGAWLGWIGQLGVIRYGRDGVFVCVVGMGATNQNSITIVLLLSSFTTATTTATKVVVMISSDNL